MVPHRGRGAVCEPAVTAGRVADVYGRFDHCARHTGQRAGEGIPAIGLLGPLLFPIARTMGINEVHYAVVMILSMGPSLTTMDCRDSRRRRHQKPLARCFPTTLGRS